MPTNWRFFFRNSMAIGMITMLLAGCLSNSTTVPGRPTNSVALSPTMNTPSSFQMPGTPSPTPLDPVNPTPTQTSTPTTIPASEVTLPYDVLFLSGDRLMRWSHTQNNLRPAVIDAVDYSASQDGTRIAILRKTGITANAVETFDLTVLDTRNGDFATLLNSVSRLQTFKISPDGQWVALMNDLQQIYILPSDGSDHGAKISECQSSQAGDCNEIAWSADSQAVIWDSAQGVWQAGPGSLSPTLVISNQIDIEDPKGQFTRKQVQFHGFDWSPFGRYILTRIKPTSSDVSWQAIIDTRLQRMAEIPDSYQLDDPTALSFWLTNGNLLVIQRDSQPGKQPLILASWQILPTREDLMSLDFRWEISNEILTGSTSHQLWDELPAAASQLDDRTLSMTLNSAKIDGPSKLFTFDIKYGILNKITDLPAHVVSLSWAPDGKAALVLGSDDSLIYVTADGNNISDLTARFGRQSCCYTWLVDETDLP